MHKHQRTWLAPAVMGVFGLAAPLVAQGNAQFPTFRAGIDVVLVDARVVDKDGRPVTGLTAEDFEVRVDGARRRIVALEFQSAGPAPTPARGVSARG